MAGDGKVSKNQRAGKAPDKAAGKGQSGDQRLMIPLNAGKHVYVRVNNKTLHLPTDSEKFSEAVRELGEGNAEKIRAELDQFHQAHPDHGWDDTRSRLEAAGAL